MGRDKKIFTIGIGDTVEPTQYVWGIIKRCNKNILNNKDFLEGLKLQEIKDLITYHNDSFILSQKSPSTAKKWIELYDTYIIPKTIKN